MVKMALENKIYDPVVGYDFGAMNGMFKEAGSPEVGVPGTDVNYNTLTSLYDARYGAARKALNDYIKYINTEAV
jgi:hypothetical protein